MTETSMQRGSQDDPTGYDLLKLSTSHLRNKAASGLDGDGRYNLLLVARAAEIAWRDRALSLARDEAARGIDRAVNDQNAVAAIRSGLRDGDVVLHGALVALTAITTYSTRPDLLKDNERKAVEALHREN